jgi:hypothetical protein
VIENLPLVQDLVAGVAPTEATTTRASHLLDELASKREPSLAEPGGHVNGRLLDLPGRG